MCPFLIEAGASDATYYVNEVYRAHDISRHIVLMTQHNTRINSHDGINTHRAHRLKHMVAEYLA